MSQMFKPLGIDERIRQQLTTRVQVYPMDRFGRRVGKGIIKDNDMILDNFGKFFACCLHQYVAGTNMENVDLKNTANATKTLLVYSNAVARYSNPDNNGIKLGVGTDATAPARTDYNLVAQTGSWTTGGDAIWTSALGMVSWAGAIWLAAGATIKECATELRARDSASGMFEFLMMRDSFADVVIPVNHFAHVAYTLTC